jgi:hypothetical protein
VRQTYTLSRFPFIVAFTVPFACQQFTSLPLEPLDASVPQDGFVTAVDSSVDASTADAATKPLCSLPPNADSSCAVAGNCVAETIATGPFLPQTGGNGERVVQLVQVKSDLYFTAVKPKGGQWFGALFRMRKVASTPERISPDFNGLTSVSVATDGSLFFRVEGDDKTEVRRIRAAALPGCKLSAVCEGDTVAQVKLTKSIPALDEVKNDLLAVSEDSAYFVTDSNTVYWINAENATAMTPVALPGFSQSVALYLHRGVPLIAISDFASAQTAFTLNKANATTAFAWPEEPRAPLVVSGCDTSWVANRYATLPLFELVDGMQAPTPQACSGNDCFLKRPMTCATLDARYVYAGRNGGGGGILRFDTKSKTAKQMSTAAGGSGDVRGIVNDDVAVYYTEGESDRIGRIVKN